MKPSSNGYTSIHIVAFALSGYSTLPASPGGRSTYTGKR